MELELNGNMIFTPKRGLHTHKAEKTGTNCTYSTPYCTCLSYTPTLLDTRQHTHTHTHTRLSEIQHAQLIAHIQYFLFIIHTHTHTHTQCKHTDWTDSRGLPTREFILVASSESVR